MTELQELKDRMNDLLAAQTSVYSRIFKMLEEIGETEAEKPANITIQLAQTKEKSDPVKEPLPCNFEVRVIGEDSEVLEAISKRIQDAIAAPSLDVIPINNSRHRYSRKYIRSQLALKNSIVITTKFRPALQKLDKELE